MMSKLNEEYKQNQLLHQRVNKQRRHKESMTSKKAKLNVLTKNNNNDDMVTMQANYQIDENNRKEEIEMDNKVQCAF